MKRDLAAVVALLVALATTGTAAAQQRGGVLRVDSPDSPASMSIHEEATVFAEGPMMGVFNNLVLFDQHVPQNSLQSVVPDLATSWSWSEDGTELTFPLRQGVRWHDGQPFTAADVKCTWDLLTGKSGDKFRVNPRKSWYRNLDAVTTNGDYQVTFHLQRPQPAFLTVLASGFSPVYPCHIPPRDMRSHPIGTGPFKFVEFRPNERIKVTRNPDYWKPDRPYLDGIEYTIVPSRSTAILAFAAGKFDMIFPYEVTIPQANAVKSQAPQAICELTPGTINRNLLINSDKPPFDNPELRRAMALSLDRQAFIDIISAGQGEIGAVMQPLPGGLWGMPREMLDTMPGYAPDVPKNRAAAREIMRTLGYSPDHRLTTRLTVRDIPNYRDAATVLVDQLQQVYINAEVKLIDTTNFYPAMIRKDYVLSMNLETAGDPDQTFPFYYGCGSELNRNGYCNPAVEALIAQQSMEADQQKRKELVWQIERKLAEDGARSIIFYSTNATCRYAHVKGLIPLVNSINNGWRMEDVWLEEHESK